ncbi:Two-component sensor histidine kinase, contains HisKA and HATPase domains [Filimonas lacunae]|uniref:histidine kinase n=1 Tax=Filimonas lacunae TaxID=477680 RepID=A0A173MI98_9BACT|nr:sensor histidine kinase [Filimonas lacunae]BAV07353.1 sensor histidine kinase [Filimonas lacunae]SIS90922.1 Two-component sensor histidine kinase, contains HisKA and HATPase domains [Filimonas lacunae]
MFATSRFVWLVPVLCLCVTVVAKAQKANELIRLETLAERGSKNSVIIGILVLIAFCIILYSNYRTKHQVNRQLQAQQKEIHIQNNQIKELLAEKEGLLDEKEWLLKEIHHRVKNNLQIVMSLLNSQSAYLDNEAAIAAIQNSQHRMYAMSLIHQKLYQTESLATINMQWYVTELVNYMEDCFGTTDKIVFSKQVEPLELDAAQAVPIGLILNETVSNSIKYAFPANRKGHIYITLKAQDNCYHLTITDDGIGLPENFDITTAGSLGMSLIYGLSMQLDGELTIEGDKGFHLSLQFRCEGTLEKKMLAQTTEEDITGMHTNF